MTGGGNPLRNWSFEDFVVGQVFETRARTITETDVVTFAGWSWDTNPVHTDAPGQVGGRFGQRIAHGALGLSISLGLVSNLGVFEDCAVALLGVDEWRFIAPILIGDTLRCRVEVVGTRLTSSGSTGVVERRLTLRKDGDVVVQQGRMDLLVTTAGRSQR